MRFIFVGIINTIFGYSVFVLFIFLGLHYSVASAFAIIISIAFNFKTTGTIVFKNNKNLLILKFFMVYVIVYLAYVGSLKVFALYSVSMYIAGAILICPLAILSFVLNKIFVFNQE
jgi:putative flippase GtrA